MADFPPNCNAHVREAHEDGTFGAYYFVRLEFLPRVGELINFFSHEDQATGYEPRHFFEVLQVVHELHDLSSKVPHSMKGRHFPTVYVRPTHSAYFDPA